MFYSIRGKLIQCIPVDNCFLTVIECGGVGFEIRTSYNTASNMPPSGKEAALFTYLHVREDALELSGFLSLEELNCFKLLLSVSGVGQKAALAILSSVTPSQFAMGVASGDVKSFTKAKGIGNKIAQRIVLELKDKISKDASAEVSDVINTVKDDNSQTSEAINALVVLGYSQSEAARAVAGLGSDLSVEKLITGALKTLGKS